MREGKTIWLALAAIAGLLLSVAAGAAEAPATGTGHTGAAGSAIKVTFALLFVVAAIFASAWFFKRLGYSNSAGAANMRILGGLSMGARERIVLVEVGDVQLVLGVAPGRVQTLHVMEHPVTAEPAEPTANTFAGRLSAAIKQVRKA